MLDASQLCCRAVWGGVINQLLFLFARPEPVPGLQVQDAVQHQAVSLLPGGEGV